ncbi:MAG: hypothetical protein AAF530_24505 [Pseudomonadota bacterium]
MTKSETGARAEATSKKGSMGKICELLPEFMAKVKASLRRQGCADLAEQLPELELCRWTHDTKCDAIWILFLGRKPLGMLQDNIGSKHDPSVPLDDFQDSMVNVYVGNYDKVTHIEIIGECGPIANELAKVAPPKKRWKDPK